MTYPAISQVAMGFDRNIKAHCQLLEADDYLAFSYQIIGVSKMKLVKRYAFNRNLLSSILLILVSGSLYLAVIDRENRPAYFDIVKVAVSYAFGSIKLQSNVEQTSNSDDLENSKIPNNSKPKE
ncbi:hypothetical protein [Nostoc sp.]